ncbi:MAG: DUF1330 domain-containing protein [Maricaulis sp.]|nr:DUF1330 domain-containing protein [Maricaulis sp.]
MQIENALEPSQKQIEAFLKTPSNTPVHMLNLLKFRTFASYEDGSDADISGREAYMRYASKMIPMVEAAGGQLVFNGDVDALMIGHIDETWDAVAIVTYPSAAKMIEITMSSEFREISVHRKAGLDGQMLLNCSS